MFESMREGYDGRFRKKIPAIFGERKNMYSLELKQKSFYTGKEIHWAALLREICLAYLPARKKILASTES